MRKRFEMMVLSGHPEQVIDVATVPLVVVDHESFLEIANCTGKRVFLAFTRRPSRQLRKFLNGFVNLIVSPLL